MEEFEAVRRCRAGDRAAFRFLVERYGDLVQRTAYLIVRDEGLAEDLAQEAFLAAWKGLATFDPSQPLKPWLVRIVVNRCLNQERRSHPPSQPLGDDLPEATSPSPETVTLARDAGRLVRGAIASLDEEQRLALVLRYFADLTVPEIAWVLGCPEGTVKSRLHRSLAALRERLADQAELPHAG